MIALSPATCPAPACQPWAPRLHHPARTPLDAAAYPHLLDMVIAHLAYEDRLVLRLVSRALQLHVDRSLVRRIAVSATVTAQGHRLPRAHAAPCPAMLKSTRVLDYRRQDGGAFFPEPLKGLQTMRISASDGEVWEHLPRQVVVFDSLDQDAGLGLPRLAEGPRRVVYTVLVDAARERRPVAPPMAALPESVDEVVVHVRRSDEFTWDTILRDLGISLGVREEEVAEGGRVLDAIAAFVAQSLRPGRRAFVVGAEGWRRDWLEHASSERLDCTLYGQIARHALDTPPELLATVAFVSELSYRQLVGETQWALETEHI